MFELTPNAAGTQWTETVLHSFCAQVACADGANPTSGLRRYPNPTDRAIREEREWQEQRHQHPDDVGYNVVR